MAPKMIRVLWTTPISVIPETAYAAVDSASRGRAERSEPEAGLNMREYWQLQIRPWEADRLTVLINRSRFRGSELRDVLVQLERILDAHHEEVVVEFKTGRDPAIRVSSHKS
jgi:hypothetical protein